MRFAVLIFALISAFNAGYGFSLHRSPLVTEYEWKYFDYLWDEQHNKDDYIKRGLYDYRNMTPIDVDRSSDGRTFVTILRRGGVPATLHTISDKKGKSGPLLKPYPDWSWYNNFQCDKIIDVYRVAIDECNRMWVLDSGNVFGEYVCPAKLLVFDLSNDKLLFTHVIPDDVAQDKEGNGLLIVPIVETYGPGCADSTVYIADVVGKGLVIFSGNRTFRLEADEFHPERKNADFTIAGESFFLNDGIFGLALAPVDRKNTNERILVFRPLASKSMFTASTKILRSNADGNKINYSSGQDVLSSQATAMAFSSDGTLFYGLTGDTAIGCWNIKKPMEAKYFKVAIRDPKRLQFASGLKVIKNSRRKNDEYLLMMTNRIQKLYTGTMNFDEINFRVIKASVRDIISRAACDKY